MKIPVQRGVSFSLAGIKTATVKSSGRVAAVVSPGKMATVRIRVFNIRNLGYGSIGGHLFPRRRRR